MSAIFNRHPLAVQIDKLADVLFNRIRLRRRSSLSSSYLSICLPVESMHTIHMSTFVELKKIEEADASFFQNNLLRNLVLPSMVTIPIVAATAPSAPSGNSGTTLVPVTTTSCSLCV